MRRRSTPDRFDLSDLGQDQRAMVRLRLLEDGRPELAAA